MKTTLLAIIIIVAMPPVLYSQSFYWIGQVSTDFHTAGNWSSTSGGPSNGLVPGAGSFVFIDNFTAVPCNLNNNASITQYQQTGGTFALGPGDSLAVTSTFNLSGGAFQAGSGRLAVPNNTFTVSGGSFDGGSAIFYIGGNMTIVLPAALSIGTSTIVFNGTFQQDVLAVASNVSGKITAYNLVINKPGSIIRFTTTSSTDTFQVQNLADLINGSLAGQGFLKIEKDLITHPTFDGTAIPIACTGPNPSVVTLGDRLAVTGPTPFVGISKSTPSATVSVYRGADAVDDTIRIGNSNAQFFVTQGIIQFPNNPPIISGFSLLRIDPGGTFSSTSNTIFMAGQHFNTGGVFQHNNGTYIVINAPSPFSQFATHNEQFYNLEVRLPGSGQFQVGTSDTMVVNGLFTIRSGLITGQSQSAFNVKGDMQFLSTNATQTNTHLVFSGMANQNLTFAPGSEGLWDAAIVVNKPSGRLILQSPLILNNFNSSNFRFTRGIVQTSDVNYLLFTNQSNAVGANQNSYVDGPVRFNSFIDFIYPIGNGGFYGPARITGGNNETITAQYFHTSPDAQFDTTLHSPSLQNVSSREHWIISKTGTSTTPFVWLSQETVRSGGITNPAALRVARWNGSLWNDEGNGATFNDGILSYIRTQNTLSSFSPFTLGSTSSLQNPLPIRLISFKGIRTSEGALLEWETSDEINNSHFHIQRSTDGIRFNNIGKVNAQPQGNTSNHHYSFADNNMPYGKVYYRLEQVDFNGSSSYSKIVLLKNGGIESLEIFPNPASSSTVLQCFRLAGKQVILELYDTKGNVVQRTPVQFDASGRWNLTHLPVTKGVYILKITYNDTNYQQTLMVH